MVVSSASDLVTARERAVRSARCVISPAIAVLYSRSPRWSSTGSQIAIAACAAAAIVASFSALPSSASSAAFALSGVGATLVSAMATSLHGVAASCAA